MAKNTLQAQALAERGLQRERRNEDSPAALADYAAAIGADPTYADAYYLRAALRRQLGDVSGSNEDYTRGRQLDSASAHAFYHQARFESRLSHDEAALASYGEALRLDPQYAQAYYSRGAFRENHDDIQGAMADYTAAIAADPQLVFAYSNRGTIYYKRGMLDLAMLDYNEAIRLDPQFSTPYFYRGYINHWYLNNLDGAIRDLTQATKLNPSAAPAHCDLGAALFRQGDVDGALAETSRAIELDSTYECAYFQRGRIYFALLRFKQAIADFTRYIELAPDGERIVDVLIDRANSYQQIGDQPAALKDFDRALALSSGDAHVYEERSTYYRRVRDNTAARADLQAAADQYRQQGKLDDYHRVLGILDALPTPTP